VTENMQNVRLGVIGTGRIGSLHARNLKYQIPGAMLVAVSDVIAEAVQKVGVELEVPVIETDYRRLLENKDLDAVIICSSTDTHAQIIEEAAAAGKHIFCEKPIALEITRIKQALAAVKKAGVKLQIGFNRRFDPSFKKAKELICRGEIGTPHVVRITSRDPELPPISYLKVSGGIFLDMTIHDFDTARFLLNDEVTEIMAAGNCLINPDIEELGDIDTAVITLKYENGAIGAIDNSRRAVYGYDQRIEVLGSEGAVMVGNKKPTEIAVYTQQGTNSDVLVNFFVERYYEGYLAEMVEFVDCIRNDKEPSVGGDDGLVSMLMGYAAQESLAKGTFVRVKLDQLAT